MKHARRLAPLALGFSMLVWAQTPNKSGVAPYVDPVGKQSPLRKDDAKPLGAITFPSEDFGLKSGDTIVEIDGQGVTPTEGSTRLYVDSGKIKAVTVQREGSRVVLKRKSK